MRLSEMVKLLEEILLFLQDDRSLFKWTKQQLIKEVTAAIKEAKDAQTGGEKNDEPSPSSTSVDGPRG